MILDFVALEEVPTKVQVKSVLNCYRILTRMLPYIFEQKQLEADIFWTVVVEASNRVILLSISSVY